MQQPGACVNCHAAEAPLMIEEMGWEAFNRTPYDSLKRRAKTGSSCSDCHDPETMALRITRPAFRIAMEAAGVDLKKATRQEMRAWVCAQCHVEYYFKGEDKVLTFPWSKGRSIDSIEVHYDEYAFKDFAHKETGAPMIKIQHPEFELWGTGVHAKSGVSCADCHMPYIREGSVKISDHWVRSPLDNLEQSCQTCHRLTKEELNERVITIQDRTAALLRRSELALARRDRRDRRRARGGRGGRRSRMRRCGFIAPRSCGGISSRRRTARAFTARRKPRGCSPSRSTSRARRSSPRGNRTGAIAGVREAPEGAPSHRQDFLRIPDARALSTAPARNRTPRSAWGQTRVSLETAPYTRAPQ